MTFFQKKKLKGVKNWTKQLMEFCTKANLNLGECNIHVETVHTFLKKDDKELDANFFKEAYNQTSDEIYQTFDVEIEPKEFDFSKVSFSFSYRRLEATMTLEEGLLIDSHENYIPQFVDYIIGFLIQKETIITSTEQIKLRLEKILHENFKPPCMVMEAKHFTFLRAKASLKNKGFTNLLEEKWCKENNKPAFQNALYAVSDGDHIGFYLKDSITTSGRNLRGEFIDMRNLHLNTPKHNGKQDMHESESGTFSYKSPPEAGAGIKKTEEGQVVKYEAQGNGIIEFAESGLRLIDIGTFQQVSKTNCILGGVEKGVEVDIDCPDKSKDAVQTGAAIEAEVVNIKGTVGEKVVIKAKKLTINGQTHQSAILYAEEANINIHKGVLYTSEADIDKLEGGKVYGSNINILDAQGAKVVGNQIVISKLHSNTDIKFCEKLHLKAIHGNDNKVSFDVFADFDKREKLSTIIALDVLLKSNINARVSFCKALADKLHQIKPVIENLKPVIERSKKEGFELDPETKKTFGFYVLLLRQIKEQKDIATQLQNIRTANTQSGRHIEQTLMEAKITTESSWKDNNQIILTHRFPPSTQKIFTQDSDMFEIVIDDQGNLDKIQQ
ncbi:hypothetical protein CQA53_07805 [Helicobacter didelphidarum]|uniref:DUF342 domain-containing protein n=1 Tax=Helicobacter didelphidarum TaxID=2040648 RepID=A0A3D8II30_9HELI|nr:hypothetical protein [Helicobacter didelphidarum]RDU64221.1 hypothetical protein CQA53_07805 [Helicobacter didelphidarum]